MKAVTWQGRRDVRVDDVPDPRIEDDTDAIIAVSTTGLCGSDLHLYEILGAFMTPGDILGHESMGEIVEVGSKVTNLKPGDRVVVPFQIACGHCFMCQRGLQTQCETTQVREHGTGAPLFGYSSLYGSIPGGQAEYLRVPHADYGPIKVSSEWSDDRYVYLSDVMPTAWQALDYAGVTGGDTLAIVGLGPIGDMAARLAIDRGIRVIGLDLVPDRLARAMARGVETIDIKRTDPVEAVLELTSGRGADGVIEAVGTESHGSPIIELMQKGASLLPSAIGQKVMRTASTDRMAAFNTAVAIARRGAAVSLIGIYAGAVDPLPMQAMFDRQLTLRMGQANVKRWIDVLMPMVEDPADPLGLEEFATHRLGLDSAPAAYSTFQKKENGMIKVLFDPTQRRTTT